MNVIGIIEKENGSYSIICDEEIGDVCLGGFGETVEAAKKDFESVVREAQEDYVVSHGSLPAQFADVKVTYKYDLQTFFDCFDWINVSKFAKAAGINESKMRLYKTGKAFAGERTKEKVIRTIRRMGAELTAANL